MSLGLLGKKVGMTRVFDKDAGVMIPVTVVDVKGNEFLQVKTTETDGYSAVQVGFDDQKENRLNAPTKGHFKKHNGTAKKLVQEFRFEADAEIPNTEEAHPGVAVFTDGQLVDVSGTTKAKGFQGVVKRYGFAGGPASHGSMFHRRGGSYGMCQWPGHVIKGKKMPNTRYSRGLVLRTTISVNCTTTAMTRMNEMVRRYSRPSGASK